MALMIELLGPISTDVALAGKYSRDVFNKKGQLKHISELRPWPLKDVLRFVDAVPAQAFIRAGTSTTMMLLRRACLRRCWSPCWSSTRSRIPRAPRSRVTARAVCALDGGDCADTPVAGARCH